ncbi:MAG: glycine zipper 2TM domain-containing protein [Pseudomonadota bacterium]
MNTMKNLKQATLALCIAGTLGACASDPYYDSRDSRDSRYDTSSNGRVVSESRSSRRVCVDCGTVLSVTPVREEGRGSTGAGAVIGAIVGGIAGHQVGGGRGQDIATAAGAIGGAVAGSKIEANRRSGDVVYDVRVEMESGSDRIITVADTYGLRAGDQVLVDGNQITIID